MFSECIEIKHWHKMCQTEIVVCTPLPLLQGRLEPPTKFSKRGGLTGSQFSEGVAGKEGVTFSGGGVQCLHKKN